MPVQEFRITNTTTMTYSTAQARPGHRNISLSRLAAFLSFILAAVVQPAPAQTTLEPACNDFANLASIAPTVEINSVNTGADCVGCVIHDIGNIPQVASYGTLEFPEDVAATIRVSVKSTSGQLPAGTLAGFELTSLTENIPNLWEFITFKYFLNGVEVKTSSLSDLRAFRAREAVAWEDRFHLGMIMDTEFDEVQMIVSQTTARNLGLIRVHGAVASRICPEQMYRNKHDLLYQPKYFMFLNPARTGTSGDIGSGIGVSNLWRMTYEFLDDFTDLGVEQGKPGSAFVSFIDESREYYPGSIAGFQVRGPENNTPLSTILPALTIKTYLNGTPRETFEGNQIAPFNISTPALGISQPPKYDIGFRATLSFNEVQLIFKSTSEASMVRICRAFVNTYYVVDESGSLTDIVAHVDGNVGFVGKQIQGNVSTNDISNVPLTYSLHPDLVGTPYDDLINVNSDGTYTFQSNAPGMFFLQTQACSNTSVCEYATLMIYILDPEAEDNIPACLFESYYIHGTDPFLVDYQSNDTPGNKKGEINFYYIYSTPPSQVGTIVHEDGAIYFNPQPHFYGTVGVQLALFETPSGKQGYSLSTVHVLPEGFERIAGSDDLYRAEAGKTLEVPAPGLLKNDRASTSVPLAVSPFSSARLSRATALNGSIQINTDGSFSYTAPEDFEGTEAIEYEICDAAGNCAKATLYLLVSIPPILPVKLAGFEAAKEQGASVLTWSTTGEVKASHFEIQRSLDGKKWSRLGEVKARGNSTTLQAYTFADLSPVNGINYYRLKMVDSDDSFEYSDVRSLRFDQGEAEITLGPNPVTDVLKVNLRDSEQVAQWQLTSFTGQVLREAKTNLSQEINMRNLPAGMYLLNVHYADGRVRTLKVLKR